MQRQILDSSLIATGQHSGALSQHSKVVAVNSSSAQCRFQRPAHTVNMLYMWVFVCWDEMPESPAPLQER